MGGTLLKLRAWWETADRTTKTVSLVGGGLLCLLLVVVFYVSSSPDMKQLFPPMDPGEQGKVIQKLQEMKIPYRQDPDGSIFVPSHLVAETRAKLATAGLPSASALLGYMRLKDIGFTTPAALQDQEIRVALEEEIQKTLTFMAPVTAAKVHIAPGEESPFADSKRETTASVVVEVGPGTGSSRDLADAIVRTVVGAVQGLRPENVSVTDASGTVLWDGRSEEGAGSALASNKREAEEREGARLRSEIERMIARSVGPGKAIVSAEVELNFDREEISTISQVPTKNPISSQKVSEAYNPPGSGLAGGIASSAAPAALSAPAVGPGGSTGTSNGYTNTQEVNNYGIETTKSEKTVAPGKRTAARVSIMLDESVQSSAQQIQQFVANYIGADVDPENFKVAVASMQFDKNSSNQAAKELAAAKSGQTIQQLISLLPIIALVVVGFMVAKAVGKAAISNKTVLVGAPMLPAETTSYAQTTSLASSATSSEGSEGDLSEAAKKRRDVIKKSMVADVEDIPEKFDANLVQILRMADQRPESVALLIKSWLLEEAA